MSVFPQINSYQIERGQFEEELRNKTKNLGITFIEGVNVTKILLGVKSLHTIYFRTKEGLTSKCLAEWVIDATGQRRILQKMLGLGAKSSECYSASWWRVNGIIKVDDFVLPVNHDWQKRIRLKSRWCSTNHLMGKGYWIWIIPLSSGHTSIGVVAKNSIHPFDEYRKYDKCMAWLQKNDNLFYSIINKFKPVDFRVYKDYTHFSSEIISINKWAVAGISGQFPDPFYSPGMDIIGFTNCIISQAINEDYLGSLNAEKIDYYNYFLSTYGKVITKNIQSGYHFYDNEIVMSCKLLWDIVVGWATGGTMMVTQFYLDHENIDRVFGVTAVIGQLGNQMQKLFNDWAVRTRIRFKIHFIDYLALPFISELRGRSLRENRSTEEIIEDQKINMKTIQALAAAIFFMAVEDCFPSDFKKNQYRKIDILKVTLNKDEWDSSGLFLNESVGKKELEVYKSLRGFFELR